MGKKPELSEVTCPACTEPVSWAATRCPHCCIDFSPDQLAAMKGEMKFKVYGGIGCLGLIAAAVVWLAIWGGDAETAAPAPAPTGYAFDSADLWASPPNDICRTRDPDFLQRLLGRVSRALPAGMAGPPRFDMFFADPDPAGKITTATVKFLVDTGNEADVPMIATGPFDPATCEIGAMKGGKMAGFYEPHWPSFEIPAPE